MTPQEKAQSLGIDLSPITPGYLNLCIRSGNQLITSGHVSDLKGVLGKDLIVEDGYAAAKNCMEKILRSVHHAHGSLNGLRCLKLLGCVYSAGDFTDQHLVINGASDLVHELYGKEGDGYHARSALGFAALPTGAAVEVEAIFEILSRQTNSVLQRETAKAFDPLSRDERSVDGALELDAAIGQDDVALRDTDHHEIIRSHELAGRSGARGEAHVRLEPSGEGRIGDGIRGAAEQSAAGHVRLVARAFPRELAVEAHRNRARLRVVLDFAAEPDDPGIGFRGKRRGQGEEERGKQQSGGRKGFHEMERSVSRGNEDVGF